MTTRSGERRPRELSDSAQEQVGAAIAALHRGRAALDAGDLLAATRWLSEALAGFSRRDPGGLQPVCAAELARVHALRGEIDGAAGLLALAATTAGRVGEPSVALARAWYASASGDEVAALREIRRAAAGAAARGDLAVEAELRHAAALLGGAAGEANRLVALAVATRSPTVGLWAEHAAAVAAVDGGRLDAVAAEFERRGQLLSAAEAAAEAAAAHRGRGDRRRSARSGAVAARLAGSCGHPRTPALRRLGPARLTPREREVGELVSRGLSNAAIARELVVSVRTVETHLAHAYVKLGVGDRVALTALLRSVDAR